MVKTYSNDNKYYFVRQKHIITATDINYNRYYLFVLHNYFAVYYNMNGYIILDACVYNALLYYLCKL